MSCATLKRTLAREPPKQPRPAKRRRHNVHDEPTSSVASSPMFEHTQPSPFQLARLAAPLTREQIGQNIRDEIHRLYRSKQRHINSPGFMFERTQDSESSGSEMVLDSPTKRSSAEISGGHERALFTFSQVQLISERLLREREEALCEKFDSILVTRLADQYDAYVKFTYDQIQKRYQAAPSYLS